jgi:glycine oxidase
LKNTKIIIIGGGIIGLAVAEQLLRRGHKPVVLEKGAFAKEASWAGAGYLDLRDASHMGGDFLKLCRYSYDLFPPWVEQLKQDSGIDPEFLLCGSLGLVFNGEEEKVIRGIESITSFNGLKSEWLTPQAAQRKESHLSDKLKAAWYLPQTCQVRTPRLTQALLKVLEKGKAVLHENTEVQGFIRQGGKILGVKTSSGEMEADQVLVAGGGWTGGLLDILGISLPMKPIRGQVVLFKAEAGLLRHVLFSSAAYLVPRLDGRIYVGSTQEDAGFDKSTTKEAIEGLVQGAYRALPILEKAQVEATWAGLRPRGADEWPYLGRIPGLENLWVASGHFTHGILLSAATGHLMAQAVLGEKPELDLGPFAPDRKPVQPVLV